MDPEASALLPKLEDITCASAERGMILFYVPVAAAAKLLNRLKAVLEEVEMLENFSQSRCVCEDLRAAVRDIEDQMRREWSLAEP